MPGYNCSIKDRMLYASSKNAVVEVLENDGIEIIKKVCKPLVNIVLLKCINTKYLLPIVYIYKLLI